MYLETVKTNNGTVWGVNTVEDRAMLEGMGVDVDALEAEEGLEQRNKALKDVVQGLLDAKAREKGYDNILSACSYAVGPNPFQDEGIAFLTMRSAVWSFLYAQVTLFQNGTREIPTVEGLLIELETVITSVMP
jgi:hypothetical protein